MSSGAIKGKKHINKSLILTSLDYDTIIFSLDELILSLNKEKILNDIDKDLLNSAKHVHYVLLEMEKKKFEKIKETKINKKPKK